MANTAVEIANLTREINKLVAERERISDEIDTVRRKAGDLFRGGDKEGAAALRDQIPALEDKYSALTERIGALNSQVQTLEQQQVKQEKATEPQTVVSKPVPPTEDPAEKKANDAAAASDVNTNTADTPTSTPNKADNKANEDNPQASNTTDLGEITVTASRLPAESAATAPIKPQPNVLDGFASYTYQAAVYLMSPDQLDSFLVGQKKTVNGYNLLFQSGGAPNNINGPQGATGTSQYKTVSKDGVDSVVSASSTIPGATSPDAGRNPYFPNDFYIDSIIIDNVPMGKGTSAAHGSTQLKFTVIEPSNITLLDCLYQAVQDMQPQGGSGAVNYAAACYLMVIRFYGYDINGTLQRVAPTGATTNQSDPTAVVEKYIPFKIKNISWEVSSKLVSYEFDCAPIGQMVGAGTRRGTIQADVEISGQTVGELLIGSTSNNNATAPAQGNRADPNQSDAETARLNRSTTPPPKATAAQQKSVNRPGLIGAMNAEQQALLKEGRIEVADEYEIVFAKGAEKIRDATVSKPGDTTNKGATDMGPAPQQNPSGMSPDKGAINPNTRNWGITAGMQMVQAIDLVIRNSNYITDQAVTVITEGDGENSESEANGTSNSKSMVWFSIAMCAHQLEYDKKRNDFAYKVTYTILPFTPQDFKSQYFPEPTFRGVVKSYPYWFTGANSAVLDYKATFNKLYTQTISGSSVEPSALAIARKKYTTSMRDIPFLQPQARSTESAQGAGGKANELAANAAEYLYNPSDNGRGEITIIGDPAWIQQGSAAGCINPENVNYSAFAPDGTINFDTTDALFEIVWQRPEDYDLGTGIADPYSRTVNSFGNRQPRQSVVYRVVGITSEFRQGRFQQKLKGVLFLYPVPGKSVADAVTTAEQTQQSGAVGSGNSGLDASGRQNTASDPRVTSRANQSLSTQLRTGVNLASRIQNNENDPRRVDKLAAALSSSATPSAVLAPKGDNNVTPTGSGQFSAAPPTPADTVSPLLSAKPVSSNGVVIDQSAAETARLSRYNQTSVGARTIPQQGARDY